MKISTKGRYGLRAMLDLALYSNGEPISLISVAERQGISVNYLEQVFSQLRKAGLVSSVKGAQGGYMLTHKPDAITVSTILQCLEGDLNVVDPEPKMRDNLVYRCIKENVWDKINACIKSVADSITLQDLINDYTSRSNYTMFYI